MTILTNDHLRLHGTPEEIVQQLAALSHSPSHSHYDYMAHVATRVRLWNQQSITIRTAQAFLHDLAAAGLLTIEDPSCPT